MKPLLIMLAGPNGAGKSTFYHTHLSHLPLTFLNSDDLARETGIGAYAAAERIGTIRQLMVQNKIGFISETVFSDPIGAKINFLKNAANEGFDVHLIFIGIADSDLSYKRVASRVEAGGHNVPEEKIYSRFPRILKNLERAIIKLPTITIYDNSSYKEPFRFIASFHSGKPVKQCKQDIPEWLSTILPKLK